MSTEWKQGTFGCMEDCSTCKFQQCLYKYIKEMNLRAFWVQACSAVAACRARSTPRRRAWTSPASSACCWAAACPGSPPGSSGGKPGRNTGLKHEQWTQAWTLKENLIMYPHQGDDMDDLLCSCCCTAFVQCQVMLLATIEDMWRLISDYYLIIANIDIMVDGCRGCCERGILLNMAHFHI